MCASLTEIDSNGNVYCAKQPKKKLSGITARFDNRPEHVVNCSINLKKKYDRALIPLDKETANKFIENCLDPDTKFTDMGIKDTKDIIELINEVGFKHVLGESFDWTDSKQGLQFWSKIYENL